MELQLLGDLANQVGTEVFEQVAHVFYLLESCLFAVELLDFFVELNYVLFGLFVLGEVVLSKLHDLSVFASQLVALVLQFRQSLEYFVLLYFEGACQQGFAHPIWLNGYF